jgi:tetratricopeptide (TPR) repeat protein
MARPSADDVDRMRREVERALFELRAAAEPKAGESRAGDVKATARRSSEPGDTSRLLPMLARLARLAPERSDAWIFAHRHLAELAVERDPWRASLFARRVVALEPADDGAWAVLGLAQSLLGHHRFAARAYERALSIAPHNPWYAHNLGHLYDVALDRPEDALPLLARATEAETGENEIAASYAHALARCGQVVLAKRVLKRAIRHGATAEQASLWRWLEAGAPQEAEDVSATRCAASSRSTSSATVEPAKKKREPVVAKKPRRRARKRTATSDKPARSAPGGRSGDKPAKKARREPGSGR